MNETRKIAAILVSDVVGCSRLVGADEDRTLARLRALRSDMIDPTITVQHGRMVKRTGDGAIVEFLSDIDAIRCTNEVQSGVVEHNPGPSPERGFVFRVGIHLGDVTLVGEARLRAITNTQRKRESAAMISSTTSSANSSASHRRSYSQRAGPRSKVAWWICVSDDVDKSFCRDANSRPRHHDTARGGPRYGC
jgi:hypothetical protein